VLRTWKNNKKKMTFSACAAMLLLLAAASSTCVLAQGTRIVPYDGASGDYFGMSMAATGSFVVMGAPYKVAGGQAYLYWCPSASQCTATSFLTSINSTQLFGQSVAIVTIPSTSNVLVVVGSPGDTVAGNTNQGAVYVFSCANPVVGTACTQTGSLTASDGAAEDRFGGNGAIAIAGSLLFVGVSQKKVGGNIFQGAVYIFSCPTATSCTQTETLVASDGATADAFGCAVAVSGSSMLVVGASGKTIGGNSYEGGVYIFSCANATTCVQTDLLTASDGYASLGFGNRLAASGSLVVVGASAKFVGSNNFQGAAYVYSCPTPSTCTLLKELVASNGAYGDHFGYSVSVSGTFVVVGAYSKTVGSNANQGTAYVFTCAAGSSCTQIAQLVASDGAAADQFGSVVVVSGSLVVVSAPLKTIGANTLQGAAYSFTAVVPTSTPTVPSTSAPSGTATKPSATPSGSAAAAAPIMTLLIAIFAVVQLCLLL
jgi:hypothetical protein